jgi:hypothetical protein
MDPISIQSAAGSTWARPTAPAGSDVGATLRQGRLVAGDVLDQLGGGFVMIGIGRHRVPARSQSDLEPGRRYLFEVVGTQPLEIRALSQAGASDDALIGALRNVLGADQPLGALLESLSAELKRVRAESQKRSAALESLAAAIEGQVLQPEGDAAALAAKLRASGQGYEARWARLAFESLGDAEIERFGRELARAILTDVLGSSAKDLEARAAKLGDALRTLFQQAAPSLPLGDAVVRWNDGEPLGGLPRGLRDLLARALGPQVEPAHTRAFGERLSALELNALPRGMREALLRALLGLAGRSQAARVEVAALAADLKALLLLAHAEMPPGTARTSVERALAGVEAEQLINVARHAAQQSSHWSVPVADGQRWTTAHVFVQSDAERARAESGAASQRRFSVAVEFSRTGLVRADFLAREGELSARVLAPSPAVAELLRARLGELEQHLALGGRRVRASVSASEPPRSAGADGVQDLRYLADHNVVDLTG